MSYDLLDQEKILIHSLLLGKDETREYILRKYIPEHFPLLSSVFTYIRENLGLGNVSILTIDTLAGNAVFDLPVRGILSSLRYLTLIDEPAQLDVLCKGLLDHFGSEYVLETLRVPAEKLQSGEHDYKVVLKELQTSLEAASLKIFQDTVVPLGLGENSDIEDTIRRVTSPENNLFIRTGFKVLDKKIGGYSRGDLIIFAAPSSHGKTLMMLTFALSMIFNSKQPLKVLFVTMEVKDATIFHRVVAQKIKMPLNTVKQITMPTEFLIEDLPPEAQQNLVKDVEKNRGKVATALRTFHEELQVKNSRFVVKTYGDFSPDDLLRELALCQYDLVVLDYLNLMSGGDKNDADWLRLSKITRDLKNIATSRNLCIISAQQLDEIKKEIRYAMAVKEHCDILIQWEIPPEIREASGGLIDMDFKKGRNVGTFRFGLNIDLECQGAYEPELNSEFIVDNPLPFPGGFDQLAPLSSSGILQ